MEDGEEDSDYLSQLDKSLDYGLYYLKYMDHLAQKDRLDQWEFIEDDIKKYQTELASRIIKEGMAQKEKKRDV